MFRVFFTSFVGASFFLVLQRPSLIFMSTTLTFLKVHGLGNDFLLFDMRGGPRATAMLPGPLSVDDASGHFSKYRSLLIAAAPRLCNRRLGVGADGLIFLDDAGPAEDRHGGMCNVTFVNADGSLSGACGNGTRCAALVLAASNAAANLPEESAEGSPGCLPAPLFVRGGAFYDCSVLLPGGNAAIDGAAGRPVTFVSCTGSPVTLASNAAAVRVGMGRMSTNERFFPWHRTASTKSHGGGMIAHVSREGFVDLLGEDALAVAEAAADVTVTQASFVSGGNAHAVLFYRNRTASSSSSTLDEGGRTTRTATNDKNDGLLITDVGILAIAGVLQRNIQQFPLAVNVHFLPADSVAKLQGNIAQGDQLHVRMKVCEAGAGITAACGTGACAAAVALHSLLNGAIPPSNAPKVQLGLEHRRTEIRIEMDGGILAITTSLGGNADNEGAHEQGYAVTMQGPAQIVYAGQVWL